MLLLNLLLRGFLLLLLCWLVCFCFFFALSLLFFIVLYSLGAMCYWIEVCVCFELKFYTFFGCHRFCVRFFSFHILFLLLCVFLCMCKVSTRTSFLLPYAIHPVFHFFWPLSFVRDPMVFVRVFFSLLLHFVCFCLILFTNRHVLFVCCRFYFFYSYTPFHSSIYIFRSDFCTDLSFSHQNREEKYTCFAIVYGDGNSDNKKNNKQTKQMKRRTSAHTHNYSMKKRKTIFHTN